MKYKIIFATQWDMGMGPSAPAVEEADHGTIELNLEPGEDGWEDELAEQLNEGFDFAVTPEELSYEETSWGWEIKGRDEDGNDQDIAFICKFPME